MRRQINPFDNMPSAAQEAPAGQGHVIPGSTKPLKRGADNEAKVQNQSMEAAGAAGAAAEIEPTDVNQQAARRLLTGLRISDSLSEENKNKLWRTGLQREELAPILAVLEQSKPEQPKQGADPCIG